MTSYDLTHHLRKRCGFEKPNHYYFVRIWPSNHLKVKSYNFHFHKNTISHDLLVKMAYWNKKEIPIKLVVDLRMAEIRWGFSISHKTPPF